MRKRLIFRLVTLMVFGIPSGCATKPTSPNKVSSFEGHQVRVDATLKKLSSDSAELRMYTGYSSGREDTCWYATKFYTPVLICNVGDDKSYIVKDVWGNKQWVVGELAPGADGIAVRVKVSKTPEGVKVDCIAEFRSIHEHCDTALRTLLVAE